MSPRPRIQDKYTELYETMKDKPKSYIARIMYELRRLDKGLCIYPACKESFAIGKYCNAHYEKVRIIQHKAYIKRKGKS